MEPEPWEQSYNSYSFISLLYDGRFNNTPVFLLLCTFCLLQIGRMNREASRSLILIINSIIYNIYQFSKMDRITVPINTTFLLLFGSKITWIFSSRVDTMTNKQISGSNNHFGDKPCYCIYSAEKPCTLSFPSVIVSIYLTGTRFHLYEWEDLISHIDSGDVSYLLEGLKECSARERIHLYISWVNKKNWVWEPILVPWVHLPTCRENNWQMNKYNRIGSYSYGLWWIYIYRYQRRYFSGWI